MSKRRSKLKDEDKIVTIKPIAYYKMLIHILRFGNKVRNPRQYREVMGMLIGRLEGEGEIKSVIIEDAIPISHGGSIEVDFKPQDYISFASVDEQFAEKNWFTVGWYHSHPGLRIFFSATDIKNQLGWQTPNPSAIGIVFDHTFLETPGDLGFRTFRLDNTSKGHLTDYHEVKTIVEPPDSYEFYFKIMELINKIHSKEPQILELNETPDAFGEIFLPEKSELLSKKPELQFNNLFSTLQTGISKFLQLSIEPLINFLNNWSQEIIKKTMDNNLQMRTNLVDLKNNLSQGFDNLQNSLKFSLMDKLNELEIYIDDRFEGFDSDHEKIKNFINITKEELIKQTTELFEEKVKIESYESLKDFDEISNKLTDINQDDANQTQIIEEQIISLESLVERINSLKNSTSENLKDIYKNILNTFKQKISGISNSFNVLSNNTDSLLSILEASITLVENSKLSIQNKINLLSTENENLSEKIQQLELDNKNLNSQLGDLNAENKDLLHKIKKLEKNGG